MQPLIIKLLAFCKYVFEYSSNFKVWLISIEIVEVYKGIKKANAAIKQG